MPESLSTAEILWRLGVGIGLVLTNAFFVAVEFGLTRLRQLELTEKDLAESSGLRRAWEMTDRLEIHLTGCQLGISSSSVVLGVVAEPAVAVVLAPALALVGLEGGGARTASVVTAVVALNLVHKIWGEQTPTYLGVERPRAVVERLAPILYWWSRVMHPVIRMGDGLAKATLRLFGVEITRSWTTEGGDDGNGEGEPPVEGRADLRRRMAALLTRGRVPRDRRDEVLASLEIDEIPARDVMVPRRDVVFLALDASRRENLRRLAASGHVRYPVLRGGLPEEDVGPLPRERIAGLLHTPALFDPPERLDRDDLGLGDILAPPVWVSPELPLSEVIDRLQEERQEAAFVAEGNHVLGLVTIMDALEAIAGASDDPLDPPGGPGDEDAPDPPKEARGP